MMPQLHYNRPNQEFKHGFITSKILGAFYNVYNNLGYGFLEKVYEGALIIELAKTKLNVERQKRITVFYDNIIVGEYYADILVEELVIVEIKAQKVIHPRDELQLINYLKGTKTEVGLLLNFGTNPQFKRIIFSNPK
jgi:GxxExxY protein